MTDSLMSRPTSARAQSETVGTVLLLGVFVIAAGAVGAALVSDVASDGDEIVVSADMTADRSDLDVSHLGGDAVSNSDLTVIIKAGENRTRIAFAPPSGEFAPATAAPSRTRSSRTPRTISCSSTNRLARCSSGLRSRRNRLRPSKRVSSRGRSSVQTRHLGRLGRYVRAPALRHTRHRCDRHRRGSWPRR